MRGTVAFWLFTEKGIRITPAYAGNRVELYAEAENTTDHPRVCGEQKKMVLKGKDY